MAKISTYVIDGTIVDDDKVIGSDANNSMVTKNYTIGDLIAYFAVSIGQNFLVPYQNATEDVDLGTFGLNAGYLSTSGVIVANGTEGLANQVLTSQGSGLPAIWSYNTGSQGLASVLNNGHTATKGFTLTSLMDSEIIVDLEANTLPSTGIQIHDYSSGNTSRWLTNEFTLENTSTGFGLVQYTNKARYYSGSSYVELRYANYNNQQFLFPTNGGAFVMSVNGVAADMSGNVNVSGGGGTQNLQQVTDIGSDTTNPITAFRFQAQDPGADHSLYLWNAIAYLSGAGTIAYPSSAQAILFPEDSGTLALSINGNYADSTGNVTIPVGTGTVTSVGLSMPSAFTVTNSPVTSSGTLAVTGVGTISQLIDGTGALQSIPTSLPPNGTAGGDLSGTYPNPNVDRIHGIDTQSGTPSANDVWVYGGSPAKWQHQHLNASQVDNDSSVTGATVKDALQHLDTAKVETSRTISTTAPLSGGGNLSANRTLSISQATTLTDGYLSSADWNTFNGKQTALSGTGFVKISGTTISYDNSTYLTSAITSLGGLTGATQTLGTGTSGTNFAIVSSGTSHTFNLPDASATNRGALTSANWSTFNNKGYAITIGHTQSNYAASTTYYYGMTASGFTTTAAIRRIYIPVSGTIKAAYLYARTTGSTTTQSWTMSIRLNNNSNTSISSVADASLDKVWSNTGLSISVVAGDYIEIITTTPAWTTAAGNTTIYGTIFIQ